MAPSSCFRNLAVTTTAERMLEEIPHNLLYMKPYGKTADSPSFHINSSASVGKTRTSTSKLLGIPTESAFSKAWRGKLTSCRVIHGFKSKLHINSMRYMGASLNGGFYPQSPHPKCWSFLVGVFPWKLLGKPHHFRKIPISSKKTHLKQTCL